MTDDIEDLHLKYTRFGYLKQERYCDTIIRLITKEIPGTGVLPDRWAYINLNHFTTSFQHLGTIIWAKPASYHLLFINGQYVCRIWTDTNTECLIDIVDHLDDGTALLIPKKNWRKCKPFTKRLDADTVNMGTELAARIKRIYGI